MKSKSFTRRLSALCARPGFCRLVVVLLVVQAVWIALSSKYPMAFDEDFHLGIIKLYAHHLSPFWSGQPAGVDAFGAVARDPSYLYHWLMSFPYRFFSLFTHDQTAIVLCLRALNIALFTSALPLYRRLLLRVGASRAITHLCLLIFVLIPVVPLLAAQINYDNLLLPVVAGVLLLTLQAKDRLVQREIPFRQLVELLVICLLASLIKYAFLPIFLAIVVYLGAYGYRSFRASHRFRAALGTGLNRMGLKARWGLGAALVVALGLFVQRYGVNLVEYHTPIPDCGQVLTVRQCSAYGPWNRDYNLALNKTENVSKNPFAYTDEWFEGMWLRNFFAVAGPSTNFQTKGPLPVPSIDAIVVGAAAVIACLVSYRRLLRRYDRSVLALFAGVTLVYVVALWLDEYREFLHTGKAVAINGRYLLPVALFVMVVGALALYELLRNHRRLMAPLALIIVLSITWGGGAWTYILRSEDSWYWPSTIVQNANHTLKDVLGPITPGYHDQGMFLGIGKAKKVTKSERA